jgi:predicted transposase/invertase (TIGR01784 family)
LWKELAGFAGSLFSKTGEIDPIIERLNNKEEVTSMIQTALKEHDAKIREQGIIQGIEKGIEKGSREMAVKTARNLLNMGLSIKQISSVIEISEKDVNSLLSRE